MAESRLPSAGKQLDRQVIALTSQVTIETLPEDR
jgi:hypothetical protein